MNEVKTPRMLKCPRCGGPLIAVRQSANSPLNADQFDAVKAGDYYCPSCPSNDRGHTPLCYWWEHELPVPHDFQI